MMGTEEVKMNWKVVVAKLLLLMPGEPNAFRPDYPRTVIATILFSLSMKGGSYGHKVQVDEKLWIPQLHLHVHARQDQCTNRLY